MFNKTISFLLFLFFFVPSVFAALPDGAGPWADSVISTVQGLRKNGTAVPAIRSNPASALGIAENNTIEGNFYSLGFGGHIVLGFDNHQSGGVVLVEATNPNYPVEKATVEVSEDGITWIGAGTVNQDGEVPVPQGVCVKYVRITDISNPADFSDDTADGYDVDGVKLTGNTCTPKDGVSIVIKQETSCEVTQVNTTNVVNIQSSKASTGKNIIKNTTGETNSIMSGKGKIKNKAKVVGGFNSAVNFCGCCNGGNTTVNVSGNNVGNTGGGN
jgi:hypothetical protein